MGTQSSGETVFLISGEVRHARANVGRRFLGIWDLMRLDGDYEIDASAGRFEVVPFNPQDDDLSLIQRQYRRPRDL